MHFQGRTPPLKSFSAGEASVSLALNGQNFVLTNRKVTVQHTPKIKLGFLYVGAPDDFGWTFQHNTARLDLERQFLQRYVGKIWGL